MSAYVIKKAGDIHYSLPICNISHKENTLIKRYASKVLPFQNVRYTLREFVRLVERANECAAKSQLLMFLEPMV